MPVLAAAAALASAGGLYKYQRENFMFDAEQKIKREYQAQDMRIKQFELYREDVRDLVELTVSKMDNYLVVNALQLGFCVILLTEGRPQSGMSPDWLIWLYAICAVGSFIYFLLSIWLAIHASISAHSFGVRLLTQFVRLPTPNTKQLDAARAKAVDYEGQTFGQLFRIPLWKQQLRRLTDALDEGSEQDADDGAADENEAAASPEQDDTFNPAAMLEHVKKYRELQAHWQSYDAFARVSMNLGTSQFLQGLSYYIIIVFEVEIESPWAAITACLLVTMAAYVVMRLDVQASALEHWMIKLFLVAPPVLVFTAYIKENNDGIVASFVPTVFLLQGLWIGYLVYLAWAQPGKGPNEPALPTRFRSILYLDVFGWVNDPSMRSGGIQGREPRAPQGPERMEAVEERASEEAAAEAAGVGLEAGADASRPAALTDSQVMMRDLKGSRVSGSESIAAAPSSAEATPAKPLPGALHASLVELCWKLKWSLDADIKCWESREVFALIDDDISTQQEIGTLRSRFHHLVVQLRDAEPEGEHMVDRDLDPNPVWLMLEWNPSGHAMTYFYNCRDGRTVWTVPEPPDRIFDLDHMQKQVADFQDKVLTVINYNPVAAPSFHGSEVSRGGGEQSFVSGGGTPHRAATASAPAVISEEAELGPDGTADRSRPQAEPLLSKQTVRFEEGDVSEPQGQLSRQQSDNFGGHEAVRLDQNPGVNQTWFGVSPMTAATFHPHQAPLTSSTPRRKSPGIMPWKSFLHTSFALIACWIIGFLWAFITFTLDWDIPWLRRPPWYDGENTQQLAVATGEPTLLYAGDWPHPYFRPEGLSCNASDNGDVTLWVLERYAVHELHLRDSSESSESRPPAAAGMAKLQTSLEGCLAQAPEFHAGGFQSMGLECENVDSRPAACFAVLFSATLERNGTRAMLRCSLDRYAAEPEHFRIHGRDWHGFTTGGRRGHVWALRHEAWVRLGERVGEKSELVPHSEVVRRGSSSISHLQVLEDQVLGLQANPPALHAWRSSSEDSVEAGSFYRWRLPKFARWQGFCAAGDLLYLAGMSKADGAVGIWQVPLPRKLRPSDRRGAIAKEE